MKIDELRSYAESNGFDSLRFKFTNLNGTEIECKWLDAYFGLFQIGDNKGFIRVDDWKRITGDLFEFEIIES